MALPIRAALRSATRYVARHPLTMMQMARHALGMRVAIPLDAIRWFIANTPPGKNAPTDITISAQPPAVNFGLSVNLMGTPVRATLSVRIDEIRIHPDELRVQLHVHDVDLKLLADAHTPVATLIKSGALDLSKPGNLVNFMPKRPDVLVEAHDDVIVLDVMKNPKIAGNFTLRRVLQRLTPVMNVAALQTEGDFLVLSLRATPFGLPKALNPARA
ncbi:MAG TPA: hypothetical protein VL172_05070 [Kofleriaceae bacterium]|jgi:hypothetical protein|nr:hypothetical protein [Kofleriaceae bacterium]